MIGIGLGIGISSSPKVAGASFDADATAFFTATGITDVTQKNAVNTLVLDLKNNSLWDKMNAIYPMVGGTATTHKYNLKNPSDSDAAFRIVFSGGWTHSSTGALPNGSNAYGDTKLAPSSVLSTNSSHISYYSRSTTGGADDLSCMNGTGQILRIIISDAYNIYNDMYNAFQRVSAANGNSKGFYVGTRTTSTLLTTYKNGSSLGTNTSSDIGSLPTVNLTLAGLNNNGSIQGYSNRECAFASIGSGLSSTDVTNLNTAVTNFQTTLSRNV